MSKILLPETFDDDFVVEIGNRLALKTQAARDALKITAENLILFDKKNQDYGPRNISEFGLLGVVMRMNDKMQRLKNILGTRRKKPQNESLQDSFRDISNYSIIATMLSRGVWPND